MDVYKNGRKTTILHPEIDREALLQGLIAEKRMELSSARNSKRRPRRVTERSGRYERV